MKVVTLCGSIRFANEMLEITKKLTFENKYCVLQCVYGLENLTADERKILADQHNKKIQISDAIYVVNIGGHIGESTRNEIAYAKSLGKEIIYHEKVEKL